MTVLDYLELIIGAICVSCFLSMFTSGGVES